MHWAKCSIFYCIERWQGPRSRIESIRSMLQDLTPTLYFCITCQRSGFDLMQTGHKFLYSVEST